MFKIGDGIQILSGFDTCSNCGINEASKCNLQPGNTGLITRIDGSNRYCIDFGRNINGHNCEGYCGASQGQYFCHNHIGCCFTEEEKPIMFKLNSMMRRLLNADIKKMIKAGLLDGDLLLTQEGKNALHAILVEKHQPELIKIAQEIIKEHKEQNN